MVGKFVDTFRHDLPPLFVKVKSQLNVRDVFAQMADALIAFGDGSHSSSHKFRHEKSRCPWMSAFGRASLFLYFQFQNIIQYLIGNLKAFFLGNIMLLENVSQFFFMVLAEFFISQRFDAWTTAQNPAGRAQAHPADHS